MMRKIKEIRPNLAEEDVFSLDALTLAYMGDVCWSFFVRKKLIYTGICHVQILHTLAAEAVSAKMQSRIMYDIRDLLSDRELKVCKRARNAHSNVPKSATVEEYREATAFEGLLGYLYLSHNEKRLDFLMERSLSIVAEEFDNGI